MYLSEPFSITLGIVIISVKSSISALMAEYMMRSWDRELRSIRPRGSNQRHIIIRIIIDCSNNDVSVSPWNMSSKFWNEKPLPNSKYVKRTAIGKSGNVLIGTAAQTKLCSMLRTCFCLNWDSHSEKVYARIHHTISSFWNSYWISSFLYRNCHRHRHISRHKQLIVQSRQKHVHQILFCLLKYAVMLVIWKKDPFLASCLWFINWLWSTCSLRLAPRLHWDSPIKIYPHIRYIIHAPLVLVWNGFI